MYAPKREAFFAFKASVNALPLSLISTFTDLSCAAQALAAGATAFAGRFDFARKSDSKANRASPVSAAKSSDLVKSAALSALPAPAAALTAATNGPAR